MSAKEADLQLAAEPLEYRRAKKKKKVENEEDERKVEHQEHDFLELTSSTDSGIECRCYWRC